MRTRAWVLWLSVNVLWVAGVSAQLGQLQAGVGVRFDGYFFSSAEKVGIDQVTLLTIPLSARAALTRQLELQVTGAYARGSVTRADGVARTLSGPTDTEVRLTTALVQDRVRISAVGLIPTGKNQLTSDELDVAGVVAADLLPFPISNWGTGGGLGLSAAAALPASEDMTVGLSAGYVVAREFEPVADNDFAYRPGNQLQIRAALDQTFGVSGKASVSLTYLKYSADQGSGANLFQAGDRLQALASYAFAAGANATGLVYAGYLRRQEGEYATATLVTPAQNLVFGGVGARLPLGRSVLQPALDLRVLGSEDGVDQGYTLSAGASIEVPLGGALFIPLARARFGSLTVRSGESSAFTGFELGFSIRSRTVQP
jgi:hypothetical protein